jgi:hypothetical protein
LASTPCQLLNSVIVSRECKKQSNTSLHSRPAMLDLKVSKIKGPLYSFIINILGTQFATAT